MSQTGSDLVSGLAGLRVCGLNRLTGKPANRQTKKGFTLVEVILTIAIVVMGLVFILQALGKEVNVVSLADDRIETALFLRQKLEEVKKELEAKDKIVPMSQSGETVQNGKRYAWQLEVRENALLKNLYEIRLVCIWKKFAKDNVSILATYVYKAEKKTE
jgi:type II secretion system protein I